MQCGGGGTGADWCMLAYTGLYWSILGSRCVVGMAVACTGVNWCELVHTGVGAVRGEGGTGVYWSILVCTGVPAVHGECGTGVYWCDVRVCTSLYWPIPARAGPYWPILVHTGPYWSVLVPQCVVGVAGGATRAALAVHQARRDNVAEVAAKDSSQETLVNGAGLLLALLLLPALDGRPWLTWGVVALLLVTHLGANVGAVGALLLPTLNRPRLRLAMGGALRGGAEGGVAKGGVAKGGGAKAGKTTRPEPGGGSGATIVVPGPHEVNPREPLLPGFSTRLHLHLGAPLHRLVKSEAELKKAIECSTEDYLIVLRPSQRWVGIGLRRGAPPDTPLRACAHAMLLEELLGPDLPHGAPMGAALRPLQLRLRRCPPGSVPWGVLAESTRLWHTLFPAFLRGLAAAGWETQRHLLAPDQWELE